jgi:hypothetical protein
MFANGIPSIILGVVCIGALASLLFWLGRIGSDVNQTLPQSERVEWKFGQIVPPIKIHHLWSEHVRLFPGSRKRIYVAISLSLIFLAPIAALLVDILIEPHP